MPAAGSKCGGLLGEYRSLKERMQGEARATFQEFESSIARDSSKHSVADGTVHPLAAYTLGYLKRMFTYDSSIPILFGDVAKVPTTGCAHPQASARCCCCCCCCCENVKCSITTYLQPLKIKLKRAPPSAVALLARRSRGSWWRQ